MVDGPRDRALAPAARAAEAPLREQAAEALREATAYFRTRVATEGGYLWRYSEDLTRREGERPATDTMAWVQPPGTPTVGMAFLTAYEATGDRAYLDAARETASALVRGQLRSGGWDYAIEFDPGSVKASPTASTRATRGAATSPPWTTTRRRPRCGS
jgi:mannose/cellobiose epimerase-like protein (N-acyl-D-glucosamine 2-epimerase family)